MSPNSPLDWTDDGQPRSSIYGDVYYSAEDGLAEARAVFLDGCDLPAAWAGRSRFTVGELGFGVGLNILALLDLWRRTGPPDARLHIFSVEAHPVTAAEAERALARWPELADLAALMIAAWPSSARGFHRLEFPSLRACLDLAIMEVEPALEQWSGRADAWFLDGFSPALNPAMWSQAIMAQVAARSAPGATAATFTVAGSVRRALSAAGFVPEKRPGFGRKRERLQALLPGPRAPTGAMPVVAVVGAGIAGAAVARALRALGCAPVGIDPHGPGAGASGNPAALVTPRLDAGLGPVAQLFAQALRRSRALYRQIPEAVIAEGVLQMATGPRDAERFARIAASDLFAPGDLVVLEASETSDQLGEPTPASLRMAGAMTVTPAAILRAWAPTALAETPVEVAPIDGGWRLLDARGGVILEADAVILTMGADLGALQAAAPILPVRGQASWIHGEHPAVPAAWGGYLVPMRDGLLFGATHDRGDTGREGRAEDHARTQETLARALPRLAATLAKAPLQGRASIRGTTPDHLPLAGAAPGASGLFVLAGLGSRGFCLAPLLGEHLAALALGAPTPLPADIAALVAPDRFLKRAARRAGR